MMVNFFSVMFANVAELCLSNCAINSNGAEVCMYIAESCTLILHIENKCLMLSIQCKVALVLHENL